MKYQTVNLVGGFYKDDSLPWSSQDCVNWIPAADDSGQARSEVMLRGAPGLASLPIVVSDLLLQGLPGVATIGEAYSFTFQVIGGEGPYTYAFGALPPGLTQSGATISGTPTSAGTYQLQLTVTDALGTSVGTVVTLFVASASGTVPGGGSSGGSTPSGPETQEVLIPNPGFESGNVSWAVVSRTPAVSPGFVITNTPGYDGSAWLSRWEGATTGGDADVFENAKTIWVDGTLDASVRLRVTSIGGGASVRAYVVVRSYSDAARTALVGTSEGSQPIVTVADSGTWYQSQVFGVSGPYLSISIAAESDGGTSIIEFDDVQVTAREFITGYTPVPLNNGGFESGNTDWTVLNTSPNDSFAIVNEPGHAGAWMLRWTATGDTGGTSFIQNSAVARNATGLRLEGRARFKCASYGGTPGDTYQEAAAMIAWYAYNDRECTDLYASGPFRPVRFSFTTSDFVLSIERSFPQPKFLKFGIGCRSNVPAVIEIDSCEWVASDTLPQ